MAGRRDIRPYGPGDRSGVDALLDADPDRLWVSQGHPLHGEPRDGERWKRTLVAEVDGSVAGAVTVARNKWHPSRYTLAVEVGAAHRRTGLGTALVDAARPLCPQDLEFSSKVRGADRAATGMLRRRGGRMTATSPLPHPDPRSAPVAAWITARPAPAGVRLTPLTAVPADRWPDLYAAMYGWEHEDWYPADPATLPELGRMLAGAVDGDLSVAAWRGDQVVAAAFAMPDGEGGAEVGVETMERDTPAGEAIVAAALAGCLRACGAAGMTEVMVDGHLSDPHLGPVLATFPPEVRREELHAVAYR